MTWFGHCVFYRLYAQTQEYSNTLSFMDSYVLFYVLYYTFLLFSFFHFFRSSLNLLSSLFKYLIALNALKYDSSILTINIETSFSGSFGMFTTASFCILKLVFKAWEYENRILRLTEHKLTPRALSVELVYLYMIV